MTTVNNIVKLSIDNVKALLKLGLPMIPSGGGDSKKHPLIKWTEYESKLPTEQDIDNWFKLHPTLWGFPTGPLSGIVVFDADTPETIKLMDEAGITAHIITKRGKHYYFPYMGEQYDNLIHTMAGIIPHVDIRAKGGFVNCLGSNENASYNMAVIPAKDNLNDYKKLPKTIIEAIGKLQNKNITNIQDIKPGEEIPDGQQEQWLYKRACGYRGKGDTEEQIYAKLQIDLLRCPQTKTNPFTEKNLRDITRSACKFEPGQTLEDRNNGHKPEVSYPATTIKQIIETFKHYLYTTDTGGLEVILGTIAANKLPGDPVWMLLVGAPGWGKTETINTTRKVKEVHNASTLTEASLLSGTPKRESHGAKGGLLKEMGEYGIISVKDFGGILSLTRETRGPILAAMREVYDGAWTRIVGSDGGRVLTWAGKAGLIGGATPSIDSHYAVMATLGERFSYYRLPEQDEKQMAEYAVDHTGEENIMREELANIVAGLFEHLEIPSILPTINEDERNKLVALATFATRCRSAVERDSFSAREIQLIPGAESPTRLVKVLLQLLRGLLIIGIDRKRAMKLVEKVALDSMPLLRQRIITKMAETDCQYVVSDLATSLGYPTNTTRRVLEDLACYQITIREKQGEGNSDLWNLTDWTKTLYKVATATSPEILKGNITLNSDIKNTQNIESSISGEVVCQVSCNQCPYFLKRDDRWVCTQGKWEVSK